MYGILRATTRNFEDNTTNEYRDSQDGFAAWITLKKLYTHGGSRDIKIDELEAKIYSKFAPRRGKTMVTYIDELRDWPHN